MDAENGADTPEDILQLREAPQLFVVDESLAVLYSSAAPSLPASASLSGALRDAVEGYRAGVRFRIFEDWIVRVEPLAGRDGSASYAVLFQRFSAADMLAAARARFGLSDAEAKAFAAVVRGQDPREALAGEIAPDAVDAAIGGLERKTAAVPDHGLIERLLDLS
jgi:hypothetical protein